MEIELELVPAKVLHALAKFADPKDIRIRLRGVWVENSRQGLLLHATDGTAVAVLRVGDMAPCESFECLLPTDTLARLPKGRVPSVTLVLGPERTVLDHGGDTVALPAESKGLRPVDWRRVVPAEVNHGSGQFDPELLLKFAQLAKALGHRTGLIRLSQNGEDGTARVHIIGQHDFIGAIAPRRPAFTSLPEDQPFNPPWLFSDAEQSLT